MKNHTPSNTTAPQSDSGRGGWKWARRLLLALGVLVTLVLAFYTEEDWRGKRAWNQCRRELEAKGEVLDWAAHIPKPVPDAQNVFKAPMMAEWFIRQDWKSHVRANDLLPRGPGFGSGNERLEALKERTGLAEVEFVLSNRPTNAAPADATLWFGDPRSAREAGQLLRSALGRSVVGSLNCVFVAHGLEDVRPAHLQLSARRVPSASEVSQFLLSRQAGLPEPLHAQAEGSNSFRLSFSLPVYAAADYLAWTDPDTNRFDLMRKALERPLAQLEGVYDPPYEQPIPNFVALRIVAQTLAQRAQCYLLLGQSEAALRELTLLHQLCRLLDTKPVTLVSAMIKVAVSGLYVSVVQDGLRLQAWNEPQLAALEQQLQEIDLLPAVTDAFRAGRASICRTLDITPRSRLRAFFDPAVLDKGGWWQSIRDGTVLLDLVPRGWLDQNRAALAVGYQQWLDGIDGSKGLIRAQELDASVHHWETRFRRFAPNTFIAAIGMPSFAKACQTLARNQTLVNQALLACALERYHRAHHDYPQGLEQLVPALAPRLPPDLFGGQPLKYRRTADSSFVLYSIGWDEKDDGGVPTKEWGLTGDWVWP